jgi:PAS domain-containing protein
MATQSRRFPAFRNVSVVRRQIPDARLRLSMLQRRSSALSETESRVVPDAMDELERALHELDVTCVHSQELLEKQALVEAEHERTRSRYYALFNGAPEPYIMTTLEGVILEVNTAASELLHVSTRWLRNKPLDLYVEERQLFGETLARQNDSFAFSDPIELTIRPRERARIGVIARVKRFEGSEGEPELWWVLARQPSPRSVVE